MRLTVCVCRVRAGHAISVGCNGQPGPAAADVVPAKVCHTEYEKWILCLLYLALVAVLVIFNILFSGVTDIDTKGGGGGGA